MAQEQIKLNRLGKPMKRGAKGQFAKGNQEGKRFGYELPVGRPKGVVNMMTLIKGVAMSKSSNDGLTNIEFVAVGLVESARELKKIIDRTPEEDPRRAGLVSRYGDLNAKIMEHLSKYSGDYTAKFQAEISEQLSDEEKEMMEKMLKNQKN